MKYQSAYNNNNNNNNKRATTFKHAIRSTTCLHSHLHLLLLLLLLVLLTVTTQTPAAEARPMDLYDEVSDFFDAVTLDDVPLSARSAPETFCRMPIRKGVCRALIPRFSYDPSRKSCVEFKFGGCDGNENNFSSYEACMATCEGM